jgi:hypothetical protein
VPPPIEAPDSMNGSPSQLDEIVYQSVFCPSIGRAQYSVGSG